MTALNVFGTRLKMACKDLTFATRTFDKSYNLSFYNMKLINLKKLLYVWYYQYHLTKFWPFIIRLKNSQKFYFQPAIIWLEHCLAINKSSSDPALLNTNLYMDHIMRYLVIFTTRIFSMIPKRLSLSFPCIWFEKNKYFEKTKKKYSYLKH